MERIKDFPPVIFRILIVLSAIALLTKVIAPRTSLYFRYWMYYPKIGNYLKDYDIVLIRGEDYKIKVKNINQRIRYSTTDFKVAGVNNSGKVQSYRVGTAFIRVSLSKKTLICRIRVIDLNHYKLSLKSGQTKRLNVKGAFLFESYKSNDPSIAKVSAFGKITAVSKGSTIITVKAKGRTMKCYVTVS